MKEGTNLVIELNDVRAHFHLYEGILRAVDDVSFRIKRGNTLELVGESGCGKTTFGRCVLRALKPTEGQILFRTQDTGVVDIAQLPEKQLRLLRKDIQMVFQDPYSSLDPRMTVLNIIGEPRRHCNNAKGAEHEDRVKELAQIVGLNIRHLRRYPHAFSGGQRQKIGIARALATQTRFIVADEPVSSLDVSIQAQVLNLLQDLQKEFHLTYLFVAHDLNVIEHISDRVAVMYVGKIVELADTEDLFLNTQHPYTRPLCPVPKPNPRVETERIILSGDVANPADPPSGCHFHPLCRYAKDVCRQKEPVLEDTSPGHKAACHFAGELELCGVS